MSDETFTQAQVDKIVRERLADMKQQRDTARDEAATYKKEHAAASKALDAATLKAERADAFEAQVAEVQGRFDAFKTRSGRESVIREALGDKYSKGAALGIIGEFGETEDAGDFGDFVAAQVDARSGLIGGLLGAKPDPVPENGAGAPVVPSAPSLPNIPTAPAMNGGAAGTPPAAPAYTPGSYAQAPAAEWASIAAGYGIKVKNT